MRDTRALATRPEVAEHIGVPVGTLTQWAHKRTGPPYIRIGRHARYRWSDVESWINQCETGGTAA